MLSSDPIPPFPGSDFRSTDIAGGVVPKVLA
jgi:hypothetical protein